LYASSTAAAGGKSGQLAQNEFQNLTIHVIVRVESKMAFIGGRRFHDGDDFLEVAIALIASRLMFSIF
jgi:hypothetical protein